MVRLAVALGGSTIDDALITLVDDPEYAFFDNGVVGLQILRRFNMATDAANKALYLKRNALPAVHERYNRAGLWIDRAGADAKVAVVGAGSPAAALDIRSGDRLVGADFATLTRRMVAPAGTVIPLTVERGGVQREVDLTLADFL